MACLKKGCLQIYCGDGKGKTTASVGAGSPGCWNRTEGIVLPGYEGWYFRRDQDASKVGDHLSVLSGAFWILLEYVG